jgi:F1F0 ATPase subunit 2
MINWVIAIAIGAIVGVIYFGGLWLTVHRLVTKQRGASLLVISWLSRVMLFLAVFYILSGRGAAQALAGFGSFWFARLYLLYRLGSGHAGK